MVERKHIEGIYGDIKKIYNVNTFDINQKVVLQVALSCYF